ncbi:class I SAM-dependent methyltransferase [Lyngbya confervoides]|uniref:Class I SAM-dependent methyltransferase n=1 Tax=Lyngbya confervoides BDU141951 TaxID=1574623 RepID=A0ABD4T876_9CYAN|nr:class I SAM-dependent methyltransferase [Lyngbya confervoides]MCM1984776.1 class I SAM-dependent methyltransferase [Lyngbya confervoides BDU141951]
MQTYYQEFHRSDRILIDHLVVRALPEILTNYPSLGSLTPLAPVNQLTSVIRSRWFDQEVIAFLERYPDAVVVNLGAKLCTRRWRLPILPQHWYDVDEPAVMRLRQTYFTIALREEDLVYHPLDFSWMQAVKRQPGQPMVIVLEGLCMYLDPVQVGALFQAVAQTFPKAHLLFDTVSPRLITLDQRTFRGCSGGCHGQPNFLGDGPLQFKWGLSAVEEFESWGLEVSVVQVMHYLQQIVDYPERIDTWMIQFWPLLEPLLRDSAQIYHLQL